MDNYLLILYEKLKSSGHHNYLKRFNHSVGVSVTALKIAKENNINLDLKKLYISSLLHDYSKYTNIEEYEKLLDKYEINKDILNENVRVLHGICGYLVLKDELGIEDEDILNAVKYHVFGRPNMSVYEEIVYLSDFVEPNRTGEFYDEIREYAYNDYKKAIGIASKKLIEYLEGLNEKIHPNAYLTYDYYKQFIK